MKKIVYRTLTTIIILILISIVYLSTVGIKTDKFNYRISSQIKKIDNNLDIRLKEVSIILNPFKFKIDAKTVGSDLIYRDKLIQLDNIKSSISIKSFIDRKFSLTKISVSTKSLDIKNLISFIRLLKKDPKIYIAEQYVKKGYIIADIELEFDDLGNIKSNYIIKGLVKDGKISLFKKYNFNKINFLFNIQENRVQFNDLELSINKKDIFAPRIEAIKKNNGFLISGKINNKNIILDKKDLNDLMITNLFDLDINEINFNSENDFNFSLNKRFKINDLNIKSKINLKNIKLNNFLNLKEIFPKIKKEISLQNHQIQVNYSKDNLNIIGSGAALLQEEKDKIDYEISKNKNQIKYDVNLVMIKNSFKLDLINYEKGENSNLKINIKAKKESRKNIVFDKIFLEEKNNIISIKNLDLSSDFKINHIGIIKIDYLDKENLKNKIQINKKDKVYIIKGKSFNINKIIENILDSEDKKKSDIFNNDFKLQFNIDKIYLDKSNVIKNLNGYLFLKDNKVSELNLESKFLGEKHIKLTIKTNGDEKITTLFSDEAKPLVDRYKFIKGFDNGYLDFYSIKKNDKLKSTLKIYDFNLKELPALTKILTLASLQGIADLLTGEGIRFSEFEMNFSNKDQLMTIDEIYAIGPAISILMNGYIEKNKVISLRGTLVPASTINRTIGSIPILGDILVGKKTGEGVFGVSFKIKGLPKNLETTVNPIKTLTPRFITRTLEKIKKN